MTLSERLPARATTSGVHRTLVLLLISTVAACAGTAASSSSAPLANRGAAAARPAASDPDAIPYIGNPRASVVLTYWFDYACPHCGRFAPVLEEVEHTYGDRIVVYYKNFPLKHHPSSRRAAIAAEAARRQGKYFAMYHLLLARAPHHEPEQLRAAASELGLDMARFDADLRDPAAAARIDREYTEFDHRDIGFVPALLINGKLYEGDMDPSALGAEIDRARRE